MKKTFISALILTALFTVTGCEDKEAKATIEQQTQTIAQLTAENTQLRAEKEKAESTENQEEHSEEASQEQNPEGENSSGNE